MRAAVFSGGGSPLELRDVAAPTPGVGEVVLAVAGCGFCHTDLHYLDHGVATARPPPLILGHEISGTVASVGTGADRVSVGDRVLVPAVIPCGECEVCRTGRENICPTLEMYGNHRDGGFAEFVRAPARDLVPVPPELDLVDAAVIADALSTPYHAVVHRANVRPGEWVAVIGCGGVGINAVQFAHAAGGLVVALDVNDDKLAAARRLGAAATVNPQDGDAAKQVRAITGGGVDVALEVVGRPETIALGFSLLRRGGRLTLVGYSATGATLPAARAMFFEYTVLGSLGCRPADYPRIVSLVTSGTVRLSEIVTGRVPLERIGEAADRLRRGEGFRTVVTPR